MLARRGLCVVPSSLTARAPSFVLYLAAGGQAPVAAVQGVQQHELQLVERGLVVVRGGDRRHGNGRGRGRFRAGRARGRPAGGFGLARRLGQCDGQGGAGPPGCRAGGRAARRRPQQGRCCHFLLSVGQESGSVRRVGRCRSHSLSCVLRETAPLSSTLTSMLSLRSVARPCVARPIAKVRAGRVANVWGRGVCARSIGKRAAAVSGERARPARVASGVAPP